jgi:hypothetical protein
MYVTMSFILWCLLHFGVIIFSNHLWSLHKFVLLQYYSTVCHCNIFFQCLAIVTWIELTSWLIVCCTLVLISQLDSTQVPSHCLTTKVLYELYFSKSPLHTQETSHTAFLEYVRRGGKSGNFDEWVVCVRADMWPASPHVQSMQQYSYSVMYNWSSWYEKVIHSLKHSGNYMY